MRQFRREAVKVNAQRVQIDTSCRPPIWCKINGPSDEAEQLRSALRFCRLKASGSLPILKAEGEKQADFRG